MDWSNERYVRLYTRDTATWLRLRWEGQSLLALLVRKVDRAGVIDGLVDPSDDLSLMTGMPVEYVDVGLKRLITHGVVEIRGKQLIMPNFIEAQECPKTDAQRQREYRERRRDSALLQIVEDESQNVTDKSHNVTETLQAVTGGHDVTLGVTPNLLNLPVLTDPEKELRSPKPPRGIKKSQVERPEDVSEQLWSDFVAHRKSKRAAVTNTAIEGIRSEAQKAGLTLSEALTMCCAQGWQGFKASWVEKSKKTPEIEYD